jgi:hypothetical protein
MGETVVGLCAILPFFSEVRATQYLSSVTGNVLILASLPLELPTAMTAMRCQWCGLVPPIF